MPGADSGEHTVRLGLWLAGRRQNSHRDSTTFVVAEPLDRTSSAYTIAESDVEAALDELKRLRAQNVGDAHAVAKVIAATNRHAKGDSLTQLHQAIDALEDRFDDRFDLLEDESAPQQPERGGTA